MQRPGLADRQGQLQDRLADRGDRFENRQDRFENRQDRFENRQDRFQDRRDRWQDWHDEHHEHHGDWHAGYWNGAWAPGARWDYWWDNYPVLSAFGVTSWATNRLGWAFGYSSYANPYYDSGGVVDNSTYDYSQPIVMMPDESTLAADPTETSVPSAVSTQAMTAFEKSQQQFYQGDYDAALASVNAAVKEMPNDTVIHEFRALVLFALGKYQDAAATLYAVLSVGPGWNWTTMSSLYPQESVYTGHLRKLEQFVASHAQDAAGHFVLAYHYVTCDHKDTAIAQLKQVVKISPNDSIALSLLQQLDPNAEIPKQPEITKPPTTVAKVDSSSLPGTWKAKRSSGEAFEMSLDDKGTFTWKFTSQGKTQTVRGVYAIDKDGVLAMELNDEGVMLAQIDMKDNQLDFYMLGDMQGAEPLHFVKA
jgi:tetratricopeptide (TPR) repeat protein